MIEERLFRLFLFSREERMYDSKNFVLTFFYYVSMKLENLLLHFI